RPLGLPPVVKELQTWLEAEVPGTVHTDLLHLNKIPDPFFRMEEKSVRWIEEVRWSYRKEFEVEKEMLSSDKIELVFEGLDTITTIWLNGQEIGRTNNMFIPWRFDVTDFLQAGKNELIIQFDPSKRVAEALEATYGPLPGAFEVQAKVYIRKAQYAYGWDWGPRLAAVGIWRPVYLEAFTGARIKDVQARVDLTALNKAWVEVETELENWTKDELQIQVELTHKENHFTASATTSGAGEKLKSLLQLAIPNPKLWWPNGYGPAHLYNLQVTIYQNDQVLDTFQDKIGLRQVRLIQEADTAGRSFIFEINGVPIFCKGANWIPVDCFIPRFGEDKYRQLLQMAAQAHINMLRVWGGGIYEEDIFYRTCDELGLMVWQDFMFACALYPEHKEFLDSVRREAEGVVRRLRNHPCLILWCGNNEIDGHYIHFFKGKANRFMGEVIFHHILPEICGRLDATRPYWPSSPYGGDDPNSEAVGDRHHWEVWSNWQPIKTYVSDQSRFVSEFGFQGAACLPTWDKCTLPEDRWPQSPVMEHHEKHPDGIARLYRYLAAHYKIPTTFEEFIYLTQLLQGEALKCGVEHWRQNKFHTSGTLIWQLNDCWPVTSWALIDYYLHPKAAYYYAKRFFAPILVSFKELTQEIGLWIINDTLSPLEGKLMVKLMNFQGQISWEQNLDITVAPNCSVKVSTLEIKKLPIEDRFSQYLVAELMIGNEIVSENLLFFEEFKYLTFPKSKPQVQVTSLGNGRYQLKLSSRVLAKNVFLSLPQEVAQVSDNYLDLLPGREKVVEVICEKQLSPQAVQDKLKIITLT
ncbi:MAG: glycoside hydrolase family 2 protein, partial [candidate division KSB1 bacterium]|nr:glycoside hydrolase family 2 protein [candidate division KSB1 bacterium]